MMGFMISCPLTSSDAKTCAGVLPIYKNFQRWTDLLAGPGHVSHGGGAFSHELTGSKKPLPWLVGSGWWLVGKLDTTLAGDRTGIESGGQMEAAADCAYGGGLPVETRERA